MVNRIKGAKSTAVLVLLSTVLLLPVIVFAPSPAQGTGMWTPVGPSAILGCGPSAPRYYCSGRVSAIALDPSNSGTIYIGGAVGGVWKSANGGSTWTPLTDDQPSLAIGSLAVDPSGVVYAGTGDGTGRPDAYYGAGVLRSADGGTTWVQLGASTFGRATIPKIIVDPNSPKILIASTSEGRMYSATDGGASVDPGVPLGIYVSTDSGVHWTRTITAKVNAEDMVYDPNNPSTIFAAVDASIFKSTDAGQTWTGPLGGGLPTLKTQTKLATSSNSTYPLVVFALTSDGTPNGASIYRSTDAGMTWTQVSTPSSPVFSTLGSGALAVDPTNPNVIYLGGIGFYRTIDGGSSWSYLGVGYWGVVHEDLQAFAFSPSSHTTLYVGTDGGIWYSANADSCSLTSCWTDLNLGLGLGQFRSVAAHPTDANDYLGGTQDDGFSQHLGSSTIWQMKGTIYNGESQFLSGDSGWTAFDPTNPSTEYDENNGYGNIFRSDDGGMHWDQHLYWGTGTPDYMYNFEPPIAIDPQTPTTLYLATYRLWKSIDKGNTWFLPSPGLANSLNSLSAIAIAPSNDQYVYAGAGYTSCTPNCSTSAQFFVSTDGGLHFIQRDTGLPLRYLTKIAVNSSAPYQVWATFSGFGGMHVYTTPDEGSTWYDITSNLPDVPTNTILYDSQRLLIYVGTDNGTYASPATGPATWSIVGNGLPHAPVYDLAFAADGSLLAATYGRGVWKLSSNLLPTTSTTTSTSCCGPVLENWWSSIQVIVVLIAVAAIILYARRTISKGLK